MISSLRRPFPLLLVMSALLAGCASQGYMSQGTFIQPAYEYAFEVPEGWSSLQSIPDRFEPYHEPFKPDGLHEQATWVHDNGRGYLKVASGKTMYPYVMVVAYLFGDEPASVLDSDGNTSISYWDGSSDMGSLDFASASTVRIKERWDRHFQKGLDRLDEDDALTRYMQRVKRRSAWKGYWEEWEFSLDGTAFRARQETLFAACDEGKTCMTSITVLSPRGSFQEVRQSQEDILDSFQQIFPFEKPYD